MEKLIIAIGCLILGLILGFFIGVNHEKDQHNKIDINIPGVHYQQR